MIFSKTFPNFPLDDFCFSTFLRCEAEHLTFSLDCQSLLFVLLLTKSLMIDGDPETAINPVDESPFPPTRGWV